MKNRVAITIQNYVQFYSVKPLIDNYHDCVFDLFVPIPYEDSGFSEMFQDIYIYLKDNGYNVFRKVDSKIKYKILLEPYPMDVYFKFNYEYRIKYKYSVISAKPKLVYKIESNIYYDAILCHSVYEEELLSSFSKTHLVGKLNYFDYDKKNNKSSKKTILYLPTYGNLNSIDDIAEELIKLSKKYIIITKKHHGTSYLYSEKDKSDKLSNYFAEVYDSSYPLSKLLEQSDVVLSDNSGSIFEALYANVPVCIFSKNMKECSLNDIDSLQLQLVNKKNIPFTDNIKKLDKIIESALSDKFKTKQNEISQELFPINKDEILSSYIKVIEMYLNDNVQKDRIKLHRYIINEYVNSMSEIKLAKKEKELLNIENNNLSETMNSLLNECSDLKSQLSEYKNGKLYRLATKIYSFLAKLRRKK